MGPEPHLWFRVIAGLGNTVTFELEHLVLGSLPDLLQHFKLAQLDLNRKKVDFSHTSQGYNAFHTDEQN